LNQIPSPTRSSRSRAGCKSNSRSNALSMLVKNATRKGGNGESGSCDGGVTLYSVTRRCVGRLNAPPPRRIAPASAVQPPTYC
jgi:hypothetical protein